MNTRITTVSFTDDMLVVGLLDGRMVSIPLAWYPAVLHATDSARNNFRLIGRGLGIHWPEVDEDVSLDGILKGISARKERVS